ncbi:MAG: aminotransferase class IV [Actinomycetota bacterium]|nr:aminotransferase class IV [Actinomycetota bacterium]
MPEQALRETIRVQDGKMPLLDRHLARLAAGGCDSEIVAAARAEALHAASEWTASYGRLALIVASDGLVLAEVTAEPSTICIPGGPRVALVESEIPRLPPGGAKPADRSFWDVPLDIARGRGADVAVLVDSDGALIDGSQATVWLAMGLQVLTPPSPPALAGVSRSVVLEVAPRFGIEAVETKLGIDDYERAQEVFLTTAVAGAVAVRDRGGSVSEAFVRVFEDLFGGAACP